MSKIDEFESLFKSAAKPVFHVEPLRIKSVMLVVDQEEKLLADYLSLIHI